MANEANWIEVDVASLETEQAHRYEVYKTAQRQAAKLRAEFEELMQADVPKGQRLVFGYRFGKLSVALVEDDRKAAKPKVKAQSLAEFLALGA